MRSQPTTRPLETAVPSQDAGNLGVLMAGALFVFALLFLIYSPVLPGSFLMDDHRLVKEDNGLVNGQFTPFNLWFQTDFTLSSVALWLQWLAWGEHPGGYHVVNILLHGLSAVLLWRLLSRLKIPGAGLVAAVFAVHPVCVNSVARIAEIKNTLSLPFFLLSFVFFLRHESLRLKPSAPGRRDFAPVWLGLSLVAFVLALLGKTSTVMLPPVLLAGALWQRGRITRQDVLRTSPFFILAMGFGLMSVWFQKHQALASAGQVLAPESLGERLGVAGRVFWFYLEKALVPLDLNIVYPQWNMDAHSLAAYLPVILLCAGFIVCWRFRHQWGGPALFGLGCFGITLFPVLGFFDSQFLVRWQVSDHLEYLPMIAPLALATACLAAGLRKDIFRPVAGLLVLVLAVMSFQRARVFASEEALMRDTLAKNPTAWSAQENLGVILAKRQDYTEAVRYFEAALHSNPNLDAAKASVHSDLGQALAIEGRFSEAEAHYRSAIEINPGEAMVRKRLANLLGQQGRIAEALNQLQIGVSLQPALEDRLQLAGLLYQTGKQRQAAGQFRKALSLNPDMPEPLNNLAWMLATSADPAVRNGLEAVRHAERACHLTGNKQSSFLSTLAAAYAEAGRFSEAVATAEMALKLQTANGEMQLAAVNQHLLSLYRSGQPYHERPAGL